MSGVIGVIGMSGVIGMIGVIWTYGDSICLITELTTVEWNYSANGELLRSSRLQILSTHIYFRCSYI